MENENVENDKFGLQRSLHQTEHSLGSRTNEDFIGSFCSMKPSVFTTYARIALLWDFLSQIGLKGAEPKSLKKERNRDKVITNTCFLALFFTCKWEVVEIGRLKICIINIYSLHCLIICSKLRELGNELIYTAEAECISRMLHFG